MRRILLLLSLIQFGIEAKILIITHMFSRADFIDIHLKTFKKFLKEDFEYIVFNDANEGSEAKNQIEQTCSKHGIKCLKVPAHLPGRSDAGARHMDGIQFALNQVGYDHDGIVMLIDSDMFLIKPFSIEKYLENFDIAGELQGRGNGSIEVRYISPAIAFMNMQTLPNKKNISFEGGLIHGLSCDVGAHTYYYFENNPSVRKRFFGVLHIGVWKRTSILCQNCNNMTCQSCVEKLIDNKFDDNQIKFIQECPDNIEFYLDHNFLHYRGGSNWDNKPGSYHAAKTNALNNLLDKILN